MKWSISSLKIIKKRLGRDSYHYEKRYLSNMRHSCFRSRSMFWNEKKRKQINIRNDVYGKKKKYIYIKENNRLYNVLVFSTCTQKKQTSDFSINWNLMWPSLSMLLQLVLSVNLKMRSTVSLRGDVNKNNDCDAGRPQWEPN